jgi:hypothetical protein
MTVEHWSDLKCHPSTRTEVVRAIGVLVRRSSSELQMTFRLDGDIPRVRIAPPGVPRINPELWRHTCLSSTLSSASIVCLPSTRMLRCRSGSRRSSRRATAFRTGRFAILPTNRIFIAPTDSHCCLSHPAPRDRSRLP